jgi:hypothetical protein
MLIDESSWLDSQTAQASKEILVSDSRAILSYMKEVGVLSELVRPIVVECR